MGKIKQLKGLAHNLADSFVSPTNMEFLRYVESLPPEKTKLSEINLLEETILPKDIDSDKIKKVIQDYKKWFISEILKMKIELNDIEKVSVKVAYKPSKTFSSYYTCNATIKAKGKDYTGKVFASYN